MVRITLLRTIGVSPSPPPPPSDEALSGKLDSSSIFAVKQSTGRPLLFATKKPTAGVGLFFPFFSRIAHRPRVHTLPPPVHPFLVRSLSVRSVATFPFLRGSGAWFWRFLRPKSFFFSQQCTVFSCFRGGLDLLSEGFGLRQVDGPCSQVAKRFLTCLVATNSKTELFAASSTGFFSSDCGKGLFSLHR